MKRLLLAACMVVVFAGYAFAAGTATGTQSYSTKTLATTYKWVCTSANPAETVDDSTGAITGISGTILNIRVTPDDSGDNIFTGDTQPTDAFNVEIRSSSTDSAGDQDSNITHDVAFDLTASCANDEITEGMPVDPTNGGIVYLVNRTLNVYASSCGAAKKFIVEVTVR